MALAIKKGDSVVVMTGADKGKRGAVLRVLPQQAAIVVDGVNIKRRRIRARKQREKGQTVERALPFPVANVLLYCEHCSRGRRAGVTLQAGKKARVCKTCGSAL